MACDKCGYRQTGDSKYCGGCGGETEAAAIGDVAAEKAERKKNRFEFWVVVMLGVTALLTAFAGYNGSEYSSRQSQLYTDSNKKMVEASMADNGATSIMLIMAPLINEIGLLSTDFTFALDISDENEMERLGRQLYMAIELLNGYIFGSVGYDYFPEITLNNFSEWFNNEYYLFINELNRVPSELYEEAEDLFMQGNKANNISGSYGQVTMIYAITLFMLGLTSSDKTKKNKKILFGVAVAAFITATVYMVTLF
jgi:heme/copper-type cytochrome/quinol oxidase subunit 3